MIKRRSDYLFELNQKRWFYRFGYFPDWDFNHEITSDPAIRRHYNDINRIIKAFVDK